MLVVITHINILFATNLPKNIDEVYILFKLGWVRAVEIGNIIICDNVDKGKKALVPLIRGGGVSVKLLCKKDMFKVLGCMLLGVICGWGLRHQKRFVHINMVIMILIALLLLVLGMEVGNSKSQMGNIVEVVTSSLVIAILTVGGSIILAWLLYKRRTAKGERK